MPCPHNEISIVQRSQQQSAVAAAAYQSGEKLFCEYDQEVKHYPEKRGIVHNEILLPANAPPEYADRNTLNHTFDEPKQWEIREINEIMNQCITGWNYFSNPRMFAEYGRQKGWEREIPATDTDNPPEKSMDGFVEVTEQMELPF